LEIGSADEVETAAEAGSTSAVRRAWRRRP